MTTPQTILPVHGMNSDGPDGDARERLRRLFAPSVSPDSAEMLAEARVSRMIQGFLSETNFSSSIGFNSLVEKFLDSRIPAEPCEFADYLDRLFDDVVAHSTRTSSPRFIGHMTSALPYFMRSLGRLMAAMNQNVVKIETSKAFSPFERQTLAIIHRLIFDRADDFYEEHIQNQSSTLGIVTSGGTLANVTALWCARNRTLGQQGCFAGVEREGLAEALEFYGYRGAVVIGSNSMHYSFDKAADVLGIGRQNLVKVPADQHNRLDVAALREVVEECRARRQHIIAIVGVAGATETGTIDPLPEIAEIARDAGTHFHVDAAWAGPLLFSRQHKHRLAGIERADSVTIDGHKQLYLPMGVGMCILRDPQAAKAIEKQARYIARAGSVDLGKRALEGSRPSTVLFLHAALHTIGHSGYEILLDEGIRKTRYLADSIQSRHEFELLLEPTINILVYRYLPEEYRRKAAARELSDSDDRAIDDFNVRLQKAQRQAGYSFVSRTIINSTRCGTGRPLVALRVVIANPLTTEADIDEVLLDQLGIASRLASRTQTHA
ncbi:MAG: putative pyridoxal-dependent aspartate 1-decarboxylase [Pyrinomonadaceae bacterium]